MFAPVQIKHEHVTVDDINRHAKIDMQNNSKYPVLDNQIVEYKFQQLPQFWDHPQLPNNDSPKNDVHNSRNMFQTEEKGSALYVKEYLQHGVLFQNSQHQNEIINQTQPTIECQQYLTQENLQQISPNSEHLQNPKGVSVNVQSSESLKQNRLGRPPKGLVDVGIIKKSKCQCEICFKEFGHKSNLFIHMRTHNGERPYKCNQCEKCFTHSGNLAIHMRTHSGERPYGCQICGKMFSHSGNLSTHLRTHSGIKPYKCSVCSKEFRHSGNLSIHERIHSGVKPFRCKVCGKDFYHSGNLSTHMKKHSVIVGMNLSQCENNGQPKDNVSSINPINSTNSLNEIELTSVHDAISNVSVKKEDNITNDATATSAAILMPTNC